jgi:hypothetical protein
MHLRGPVVVDSMTVDDARCVVDDAGGFESGRHRVFSRFFGGIVDSFGAVRDGVRGRRGVRRAACRASPAEVGRVDPGVRLAFNDAAGRWLAGRGVGVSFGTGAR